MSEMLSVEGSSLSERALASRNDRLQHIPVGEMFIERRLNAPLTMPDPLSSREQTRAEVLTGVFWAGFFWARAVSPEQRPAYRGKVTGAVRTLLSIFDRWQIDENDAALFLGSGAANFVKDLRAGTAGLTARDAKDRAGLLVKIYEGVHSLMHDEKAERSWIRAPLGALGDRSILDIMRGGSLFDLMYVNKYIDHVNGR
jgi:Protein of unknown function (DUF2384)